MEEVRFEVVRNCWVKCKFRIKVTNSKLLENIANINNLSLIKTCFVIFEFFRKRRRRRRRIKMNQLLKRHKIISLTFLIIVNISETFYYIFYIEFCVHRLNELFLLGYYVKYHFIKYYKKANNSLWKRYMIHYVMK